MSPIYSILVFVCIFNAINAADQPAKLPTELEIGREAAEKCSEESGISEDEVVTFFTKQQLPEGEKGKAFILCYLTKTGILEDDQIRWDVMRNHLNSLFGIDQDNLKKMEATCKNHDDSEKLSSDKIMAIAECVETEIGILMKMMKEKLIEAEIAAANSCADRNGISSEQVLAFLKEHKFPEADNRKEFIACYSLATGLVKSNKRFNWEGLKAKLAIMKEISMDTLDKIEDTCREAEDYEKEEKQRLFDIADCVRSELLKQDGKSSEEGDSS